MPTPAEAAGGRADGGSGSAVMHESYKAGSRNESGSVGGSQTVGGGRGGSQKSQPPAVWTEHSVPTHMRWDSKGAAEHRYL